MTGIADRTVDPRSAAGQTLEPWPIPLFASRGVCRPVTGYVRGMEHFTIATVAEKSPDFRRVLWTGKNTQLVIMTIPAGR